MKAPLSNESVLTNLVDTEGTYITENKHLPAVCDSLRHSAKLMGIETEGIAIEQIYFSIMDRCEKHEGDLIKTDYYSVNLNGVAVIGEVNGTHAVINIISEPIFFINNADVVTVLITLFKAGELSTVEVNCPKSLIPEDKEITPQLKLVSLSVINKLTELDCIGASGWQENRVIEFLLSGLLYSDLAEPHIIDKVIKIGEQTVQLAGNEIFEEFDTDELLTISI